MKIGDRIKSRREGLNMSQDELAKKTGYKSRSSINKIEKGLTDINQEKILLFSKALDTTVAYLMGWSNAPDMIVKDGESVYFIESKSINNNNSPTTIAAHHDGEDWTEEELEDIELFKEALRLKRAKKRKEGE